MLTYEIADVARIAREGALVQLAPVPRMDEELDRTVQADVPAGGTVTARAMARLYAALLGEVDGVRLLSRARLREVTAVAVDAVDQIFGNRAQMGLGYAFGGPLADALGTGTVFGWSGAGGSHASADTTTGTAFALTKNRFTMTEARTDADVAAIVATAITES